MRVSVIINTYSMERYDDFLEAVEAVRNQTYDNIELLLIVDGNTKVYQQALTEFSDLDNVVIHCTPDNIGNSASRTVGCQMASGDIVVVTDDDGVADPDWIEEIVAVYERTDAIAVGGQVVPDWVEGEPNFFPNEFLWLVGCNELGFAEHMEEVRNTYGPNLSFRKDVFDDLGGFSAHVGRHGDKQIQAHETEICARMKQKYGRGVIYTENAVINHKVYPYRTKIRWLVRRCFWQGYSKRLLEQLVPNSTGNERTFLKNLLTIHTPNRIKSMYKDPSRTKVKQLITLYTFTLLVGLGYLYALTQGSLIEEEETDI